ncbi:MAG: hypothetical protein PHO93_01890 [Candidatus Saccharimonadaceae bacterium]|nr:hypothetical protein [Candidatus Saccharimonadaceae bacterium]
MITRKGFALPTILIASVVLLTVLLASVVSITSVRSALSDQYYNSIAQSAADAGLEYAKSCLDASSGLPTWSDSKPLKPNTDCSGNDLYTCDTYFDDSHCAIMTDDTSMITTFTVGLPDVGLGYKSIKVNSVGVTKILRPDETVWREYARSKKIDRVIADESQDYSAYYESKIVNGLRTCVIASNDRSYCWGYDTNGELGDDAVTSNKSYPVAVDISGVLSGKNIVDIDSGHYMDGPANEHTCALTSEGKAYCWGANNGGQLGKNSAGDSGIPTEVYTGGVLANKTILKLEADSMRTCAIASDYKVYCWGYDSYGELGDDAVFSSKNYPVAVDTSGVLSNKKIIDIASSFNPYGLGGHTCVLDSEGKMYCWGLNNAGQLGNNSTTNSGVPVAVDMTVALSGLTVREMFVNGLRTCVIASNNRLYCWGYDANGELGDDAATSNKSYPVAVDTSGVLSGKDIVDIDGGFNPGGASEHTCALTSEGKAYCWGANNGGQLGKNSSGDSGIPTEVYTGGVLANKTIQKLEADGLRTCVIASDYKVYCWGYDSNGELGDDVAFSSKNYPVAVDTSVVLSGKKIIGIASSSSPSGSGGHTCVLDSEGKMYCWGLNNAGQLGNNSTTNSGVPVAVDMTVALSGLTVMPNNPVRIYPY